MSGLDTQMTKDPELLMEYFVKCIRYIKNITLGK